MTGRPTLLTPELQQAICDNILLGLCAEEAAEMSGVSLTAFYTWKRRGQAELDRLAKSRTAKPKPREAPFAQFTQAVKKAQLEFKRTHVVRVQQAGKEHWQASAWLLERRFPNEYGQKVLVRQQVEQELEAALDRLERELDGETLATVLRVIAGEPGEQAAGADAGGGDDGARATTRPVRVDAAL